MNTQTNLTTPRMITVRQTSERLGLSRDSIRRLCNSGVLKKITLSPRCVRIDLASIEQLEASGVTHAS
ncbi:helix-turn-helix domain-containing protein [Bradyrhizobium liaoningense]|uniref:helix-turn-helix transcriptional regulator n=1 Tax=Bradyrhizobium liaoningense TaxID=43992 RepID=UPI001BA7B1E9|nr:helix-turn-helix domain-containing protein [Bradyrhizobium liaoningense]MBR0882910.1 helix-turn-helix domain-containing protein [Bradyrhizobium liaoningense]